MRSTGRLPASALTLKSLSVTVKALITTPPIVSFEYGGDSASVARVVFGRQLGSLSLVNLARVPFPHYRTPRVRQLNPLNCCLHPP